MKKQNRFPYQVSVKLTDEARQTSEFLKTKGVDVGELSRRAVTEAIEKAAKHFTASSGPAREERAKGATGSFKKSS